MTETSKLSFESLASDLSSRLASQSVTSSVLLGGARLIDDSSRLSGQYQDPNYLPFYYHVGRVFDPGRILCVGLDLGLQVSCLLKGCSQPESAFCIQEKSDSFYSPRLAISNVRASAGRRFPVAVHVGGLNDPGVFESCRGIEAAIITGEMAGDPLMESMSLCWSMLSDGGILCVDRLSCGHSEDVFRDFCRARGASSAFFGTRYGSGIASR